MAINDIEEGEELFTIPRRLIMDARTSDLKKYIPTELKSLDTWQQITLVMIYESGKGEESFWYLYWKVLPKRVDNILMNWSEEELDKLKGSTVLNKIGKEQTNKDIEKHMLPVVKRHADIFGAYAEGFKGENALAFLLDVAHRMAGIMMAYAFDVAEEFFELFDGEPRQNNEEPEDEFEEDDEHFMKGMVPLADMLNASGPKNNVRKLADNNHYDEC